MPSRGVKESRKKNFRTFIEDMRALPRLFREGQERERKNIEEFKKKKKK